MASAQKQQKAKLWRSPTPGGSRAITPRLKREDPLASRPIDPGRVVPSTSASRFKAAVTAKRTPTVPVPGVVPGTTYRVPAAERQGFQPPAAPPTLGGLARAARPNPKTTPSHTLTGARTATPYHKPTPAPAPSRSPGLAAGAVRVPVVVAPAPAALPVPAPPASTHLMGSGQGFAAPQITPGTAADAVGGAATTAAQGVLGGVGNVAGLPAAPPAPIGPTAPVAGAPAAPAGVPVAPAAADPYAGLPPEVATLLRGIDQTTNAQNTALGSYFNTQAGASQDFAKAISGNLGGLAQMAGFQPQTPTVGGMSGPIGALPAAMAGIGQQLTAGQGFDISNMASIMPGFLRRAGTESQTALSSAGAENRGKVLTDYIDQQGQLAQTQAEQQGLDTRAAAQIGSNEKIAAAQQAVTSANNTLDFVSNLYQAAIRSGDANAANQLRAAVSQATIGAQNARTAADNATRLQTNANTVTGQNARAAAALAAGKGKNAGKVAQAAKAKWAGKVKGALTGERVSTGSTSTKVGTTTTRTPTYGYENQQAPDAVMAQMISEGVTPRDAYNMVVAASRGGIPVHNADGTVTIHPLVNPEQDLWQALGGDEAARQRVIRLVHIDPDPGALDRTYG